MISWAWLSSFNVLYTDDDSCIAVETSVDLIFLDQTSTQIGEGLTCMKHLCKVLILGNLVQFLQKASLAAEITGREIL